MYLRDYYETFTKRLYKTHKSEDELIEQYPNLVNGWYMVFTGNKTFTSEDGLDLRAKSKSEHNM